jgi:hypothetical protein
MPEAFGLGDLNPFRIVQGKGEIGESGFGSMLIGAALMAAGVPNPMFAAALTGGATLAMGGNLKQAFGQGLGAYGGASMASSAGFKPTQDPNLATVGELGTAVPAAAPAAPVQAAPVSATPTGMDFGGASYTGNAVPPTQAAAQVATTTPLPTTAPTITGPLTDAQVDVGLGKAGTYTPVGEQSLMGKAGQFVSDYKWPLAGAATLGLLMEKPKGVEVENQHPGLIRPYIYDPKTQGLRALKPVKAPGYAAGGMPTDLAGQQYPMSDMNASDYAIPFQTPGNARTSGSTDVGVNPYTGEQRGMADGGVTGSGQINLNVPLSIGGGSGPQTTTGYSAAGSGVKEPPKNPFEGDATWQGYTDQYNKLYGEFQNTDVYKNADVLNRDMQNYYEGRKGDIANDANWTDYMNRMSEAQKALQASDYYSQLTNLNKTAGDYYNKVMGASVSNPYVKPPIKIANGGMTGGGISDLGGYSDGGRLLRGPGDGVSDSIPAMIGRKQPARLADGEFVVPARIVSEIGNGSTEAGARKLYAMMDRVQKARSKTTGKNKVAANTRADKYLPA